MIRSVIRLVVALSILSLPVAASGADLSLHCSLEPEPSIGELYPPTAVVAIVNGAQSPLENVTLQLAAPAPLELKEKVWQAGTIAVGEVGIRPGAVHADTPAGLAEATLLWQVNYELDGASRTLTTGTRCKAE